MDKLEAVKAKDAFWPIRITHFAPSHRQFRLNEALTPEQITKAVGCEPTLREPGGKVTMQWQFWAELVYFKPDGTSGSTSTCCKIWDYDEGESRWSAYGWPEAFEQIGLTPLMSKDYGSWTYEEDGNPTLSLLRAALSAIPDERAAIVAWLRTEDALLIANTHRSCMADLITAIENGDHLKEG